MEWRERRQQDYRNNEKNNYPEILSGWKRDGYAGTKDPPDEALTLSQLNQLLPDVNPQVRFLHEKHS